MNNLEFLRLDRGWSQAALAEAIGRDRSFTSRLCNGWFAKVPQDVEAKLTRLFEMSFKELMEEKK